MAKDFRCVITGEKGGSGKSLLAVELALIASTSGIPTTLIDGDPQETSSTFLARRERLIAKAKEEGHAMANLAMPRFTRLAGRDLGHVLDAATEAGSAFQVVDLAGRDGSLVREAMRAVDVVLVPVRPTAADLNTAARFDALVGTLKGEGARFREAFFVINQAPTHPVRKEAQLQQAISVLTGEAIHHTELMDMAVSERFHFVKGWLGDEDALSVTEMAGAEKAAEEILGVYDRLTRVAMEKGKAGRAAA